ncbi:MAG: hypothetical protein BMS9Abin26_0967 [Gammaproteobacteria bacterium]|nr:MAG: hypothetical protein BMS9Abin26_0967 [Gammaproteobacteria bacterium]
MIIRIFRVRIDPALRDEFEAKFADISIRAVEAADGFISVEIGKPSVWAPDEYVMISRWQNEEALRKFAGDSWNQAHIPSGMEKFIMKCWVHHYESFEII